MESGFTLEWLQAEEEDGRGDYPPRAEGQQAVGWVFKEFKGCMAASMEKQQS